MENQIDKNAFPVTIPEKQRFLALFIRNIVTSQKLRAALIIIPPSRSRGVRSLGFQP
jgi:hypothetical protein